MEHQGPTYDKANSILEMRRSRAEDGAVLHRIARFAAAQAETSPSDYRDEIVRQACTEVLSPNGSDSGRLFFLREHVIEEIKRLADEENLLTIPGDMFGAGQERFVRLAFANVADDKIPAVLERLERFGA